MWAWLRHLLCRARPLARVTHNAEPSMKCCSGCAHWAPIYDLKNGGTEWCDGRLRVRTSAPEGHCTVIYDMPPFVYGDVTGSHRFNKNDSLITMGSAKCNKFTPAESDPDDNEASD